MFPCVTLWPYLLFSRLKYCNYNSGWLKHDLWWLIKRSDPAHVSPSLLAAAAASNTRPSFDIIRSKSANKLLITSLIFQTTAFCTVCWGHGEQTRRARAMLAGHVSDFTTTLLKVLFFAGLQVDLVSFERFRSQIALSWHRLHHWTALMLKWHFSFKQYNIQTWWSCISAVFVTLILRIQTNWCRNTDALYAETQKHEHKYVLYTCIHTNTFNPSVFVCVYVQSLHIDHFVFPYLTQMLLSVLQ